MKNHAFRRLISLLALTSLMATASCGDDEIEKKTITISVPESAIPLGQDVWFFITDKSGKLLGVQEAFRGFDVKFEIPAGEKITLNKLTYLNTITVTDFRVYTYTNVSPGNYSLSPITTTPDVEPAGFHYLQVTDLPITGLFGRAAGSGVLGCQTTGSGMSYMNLKTFLTTSNIEILYYLTSFSDRTFIPRYKVYPNASFDASETLSFDDMIQASKNVISFDKQIDGVTVSLSAQNSYGVLELFSVANVTTVPLYFPGNVISTYRTQLTVTDGNEEHVYYKAGSVPTVMKKVPVTVNSLTTANQQLSVNITGSFDYLYAYKLSEWTTGTTDHYLDWLVYMDDQTETFQITEVPAEIIARYPELQTMPSAEFNHLLFYESDNLAGYDGYLKRILNPEVPSTTPLTESVSLRKIFGSPSSKKRQLP
jgi:hypothetical protein